MFKTFGVFLLTLSLALQVQNSEAVTAYIYGNGNCTGSVQMTISIPLGGCKDLSQGGFSASAKAVICNSTWARLENFNGNSCAGSPTSVQTAVPQVCTDDGQGSWVKVDCTEASPSSPTIKSSSSNNNFGYILGFFGLICGIIF